MSVSEPLTPPPVESALTRAATRKALVRLMPLMGLLYLFNYLDRVNVGYASLTMNEDLGLSNAAYGLGAGLFFIGYFVFEVPSNLMLHKLGARVWIARIAITWGLLATAMAFVTGPASFYAVRFLLGVAEAGLFPGLILYMTYWFPRARRSQITGLFLLAIPLSSVLGAPVSTLILQNGTGWIGFEESWRVMFFVQGIPPVLLGVLTLWLLPSRPRDARWLSAEEKDALVSHLEAEEAGTVSEHWTVRRALTSPRVAGLALAYFGTVYGLYSLSFFLPQVIEGLQETYDVTFGLLEIGLISAVPFGVGAVVMLLVGRHSDRVGERRFHAGVPVIVGAASVAVALYLDSPFAVVAAISVTAAGILSTLAVFWQLPSAFLTGAAAAGGIALINSFGNLSGFVGPYLTGWLSDLTGDFRVGFFFVAGFMTLAGVVIITLGRRIESRQSDPRQSDPRQSDPRQSDPRQSDPRQTEPGR